MNLSSATALVTGGAVRIGRAICLALAAEGCRVIVHYDHSREEAEELLQVLRDGGCEAFALRQSLASERDCEALMAAAEAAAGVVDVLVNNAAVFHKDTLLAATEEKMRAELQVNLVVPMLLMRAFASRLRAARHERPSGSGAIINLLDRRIAGVETDCLPYVLSKKMLAEATRSAALELAPDITVNGVAPGAILPPPGHGETYLHDAAGRIPLQCRCTPEDVAGAVVFLLEAGVITGQTVFVDGGQHLVS